MTGPYLKILLPVEMNFKCIILLLFLFSYGAFAQGISSVQPIDSIVIPKQTSRCFIDPIRNIYFVHKDEICKLNTVGVQVKQSIKKWQEIDGLEAINSLKVAVFSAEQQQICLLDNTLSPNGSCINLEELGLINVTAISASKRPDMIWLYDEMNSSLVLFNYVTKKEIQRVDNLQGILGLSGSIKLNENESGLWVNSSDGKICLMDDYMNVVRCASETNQAMIPYANGFFFVNENTLYYRDLFEGVKELYKISTAKTIKELYVSGNQLITNDSSVLKVFIIQP